MSLKSIDEVIIELSLIVDRASEDNSRVGYFAAMYRKALLELSPPHAAASRTRTVKTASAPHAWFRRVSFSPWPKHTSGLPRRSLDRQHGTFQPLRSRSARRERLRGLGTLRPGSLRRRRQSPFASPAQGPPSTAIVGPNRFPLRPVSYRDGFVDNHAITYERRPSRAVRCRSLLRQEEV